MLEIFLICNVFFYLKLKIFFNLKLFLFKYCESCWQIFIVHLGFMYSFIQQVFIDHLLYKCFARQKERTKKRRTQSLPL